MKNILDLNKHVVALSVSLVFGLTLCESALANTVSATYNGLTYGSSTINVKIADSNPSLSSIYTSAGSFNMVNNSNGSGFVAYCADIYQWLAGKNVSTNYDDSVSIVAKFGSAKANDLQKLVNNVYSTIDTAKESAAFQLATWEILFQNSGSYNLSVGDFKAWDVSSSPSGAFTLAQNWLNTLNSAPSSGNYKINFLTNANKQDLIYMTPNPVPLPAALPLMLTALGALGFVTRRRKSDAT